MNDELEPEILSYREFRNRETLRAWEQRRRAFESQPVRGREARRIGGDLLKPSPAPRGGVSPRRSELR
jgi:hypothetical protein